MMMSLMDFLEMLFYVTTSISMLVHLYIDRYSCTNGDAENVTEAEVDL